jgi:hypothetical protein
MRVAKIREICFDVFVVSQCLIITQSTVLKRVRAGCDAPELTDATTNCSSLVPISGRSLYAHIGFFSQGSSVFPLLLGSVCVEGMMVIYDNVGKKIGEINTIIRPSEGVVSNTVYSGDRIVTQTISTRDNTGNVKTETVYGGKILP